MAVCDPDARIRVQVRLALTAGQGGDGIGELEASARALGLTGAEIDAARAGRCFDARAAAAVDLALAVRAAEPGPIAATRTRAERLGLGPSDIDEIERMASEPDQATQDRSRHHA